MMRKSDDLPEPLGPMTPILAPGRNDSQMPFRISRWGHHLAQVLHREDVLMSHGVRYFLVVRRLTERSSAAFGSAKSSDAGACDWRQKEAVQGIGEDLVRDVAKLDLAAVPTSDPLQRDFFEAAERGLRHDADIARAHQAHLLA